MLQGYAASLLEGLALTLTLAVASLVIAFALGLAGAAAKLSHSRVLRVSAALYTTLIRGIPDLILVLLVYYGGQTLVNRIADAVGHTDYIGIDPFVAGVLTIGFIFGAYFTETFRGAFLAVPSGQREAGLAFGLTNWQVLHRITAPQMLQQALPALSNNWLVLVKSTAIVSLIGLNDLMLKAQQASGATREPFVFYGAVVVLYLAVTGVSELVFRLLARRGRRSVRVAR